jgi:hypothetical protein
VIFSFGSAAICARGALSCFDSTKYSVTDFAFVEAYVLHVVRVAEHGESAKFRIGRGQQKAAARLRSATAFLRTLTPLQPSPWPGEETVGAINSRSLVL